MRSTRSPSTTTHDSPTTDVEQFTSQSLQNICSWTPTMHSSSTVRAQSTTPSQSSPDAASPSSPSSHSSSTTPTQFLRPLLLPLLCGMCFGGVFQLSRVHEFFFVREQMLMHKFLMLKMFLSAAATSIICINIILPLIGGPRVVKSVANQTANMTSTLAAHRGVPSLALGAAIMGAGIAICGSCPGTVFAQVASGSVKAWYIMVGGFTAAIVYPLVEAYFGSTWNNLLKRCTLPIQRASLDTLLNTSRSKVALSLASLLILIVIVFEAFFPYKYELLTLVSAKDAALPKAIPPEVAGIVVGLLQIPLLIGTGNHLGCSSSYVTIVASTLSLVSNKVCEAIPLYKSLRTNYWQVALMVGVSCGALLTSCVNRTPYESDHLISIREALCGGVLLVTGARIAAGCTSGHGISGMGYLAINSFIAVAAMFTAGIAAAFILYR